MIATPPAAPRPVDLVLPARQEQLITRGSLIGLCAVFGYQLLIRHHWKNGGRDAQIRYLMDGL